MTALILLPIAVALILYAPIFWLAAALTLVMLLAAHEWAALSGYVDRKTRAGYAGGTLLLCGVLYIVGRQAGWEYVLWPLTILAAAWWLWILIWLVFWRGSMSHRVKMLCGWLTLIPSLFTSISLADTRPALLLWLFAIIWAADIGAYFAGRAFGRHKLAPEVSPGKTWEGVAGGTTTMLLAIGIGWWWLTPHTQPALIVICVFAGWFSIVGDLSESFFKRQAGLKDSGTLFPGHGGVLDRVDSLTAAAPFFWLGLKLAGWLA
ncbi:MAG: phosphatidate cytidylyltransferase [Gammaproteobacteria bacterium]